MLKKRILGFALCVCILLSATAVPSYAAGEAGQVPSLLRVLEDKRQGLLSGASPADTAAVDADIASYGERRRRIP